jgi:capsular exopolysaccharide synthesis family protein
MSHIFDAIQKSEFEQGGVQSGRSNGVKELLARLEHRTSAQRQVQTSSAGAGRREEFASRGVLTTELNANPQQESEHASRSISQAIEGIDGHSATGAAELLAGFRTLDTSVSEQSRLIFLTKPNHPAAEAYRLLTLRLLGIQRTKGIKKLLITSSLSEEGKSLTTANLACSLAEDGHQKVLLLEGDLRRPVIGSIFGFDARVGACEYLQGKQSIVACIYRLKKMGLWVMPAGKMRGNVLEVLQSNRLEALMTEMELWFDWILVDAPPVMPLADTSVWMRLVDGILFVARQGAARKRQLRNAIEALDHNKIIGGLVNCASSSAQYGYYYNHYSDAATSGNLSN